MQLRFWGTRGSLATPGPGTVRYGGNTSCLEVRSDTGDVLVLDCGTGARLLGTSLGDSSGALLIGHTHWDHIQGLPFFSPLFCPASTWDVHGPRGLGQSLATTLEGQMTYQYFPVTVDQLGATVHFHDLVEGSFEVAGFRVTAQYLNHPAMTLGYRIEADGTSLAYACDHEPFDRELAHGGDPLGSEQDARHVEFLRGVDVLVHDAQYAPEEYDAKRGWGHSTYRYAVDVARCAGVRELVLTHHDPARDDEALDALVESAREYAARTGYDGVVHAAAEGGVHACRPRTTTWTAPPASALACPTDGELVASVVAATPDAAVRAAVVAAADAELLPVVEGGAGVLVVADVDAEVVLPEGARAVLALTRGRPSSRPGVTDWLVWPSSIGHLRTKLRCALMRRACRWQAAPLPPDESARVAALRATGLLDSPAEERFDRWTREAREAFDVPVALVTLVDAERQWFKSCDGFDASETHRDRSLCAHAILEPDLLHVPDLQLDDRFADNPAAKGLRFYAGVPLVLDDHRVGTLCVADARPRALDPEQLARLRALALQVQRELQVPAPL